MIRHARGFTLIEILVALAILAVALAAAVRSASIAADGTLDLRERLAGTWVAQDRLAEYTARPYRALFERPERDDRGTPTLLALTLVTI